jgi:hypothetical protein
MRAHIAVVLGVVGSAGPAIADPEGKRLFTEGRTLLEAGRTAEACRKFAQSLEHERAGGTMLNLADCAERAGQLTRAWALYDEAAREYERTNKAASMKFARGRATALEPRLAVVVVRVAEPDTEGLVVRIGAEEVTPVEKISRFHDPGPLTVTARAPGRTRFTATVEGTAGAKVVVEVPALAVLARDPGEPSEPRTPREEPPAAPGGGPWRTALLASLAVGVGGGVVWLYGWRQVVTAEEALCPPDPFGCGTVPAGERERYIDQGSRGRTLSYVGGGVVAGSLVLAGVSAYLAYGRDDRPSGRAAARGRGARALAVSPAFSPIFAPAAVGVALHAGF